MSAAPNMIEAKAPVAKIRSVYDFWSFFYGKIAAPLERKPRMLGLEKAGIGPRDRVLEVAVGPGSTLLEILKRVDRSNTVYGVDLSPKMLEKARKLVKGAGYANADLQEADARKLPFRDGTFDVLYNSYMLDLIPFGEMRTVLGEFRRVLKPGGRMVLVNFSKKDGNSRTLYERAYEAMPSSIAPYIFGGCRPVLMEGLVREAGFSGVTQEFVPNAIPAEIVTARKPDG